MRQAVHEWIPVESRGQNASSMLRGRRPGPNARSAACNLCYLAVKSVADNCTTCANPCLHVPGAAGKVASPMTAALAASSPALQLSVPNCSRVQTFVPTQNFVW